MATEYLYINTRDELLRFDCSKIVYMEGDGNYTNIMLVNKLKASVCMNLSDMQRLISESLRERATIFARIGKRFIVNRNAELGVIPNVLKISSDKNQKKKADVPNSFPRF